MIGVHYANFCLLSKTLKLKSEKIYNYIQKVGTWKGTNNDYDNNDDSINSSSTYRYYMHTGGNEV